MGGRGGEDYVVSGLGWPSFSDELRTTMLEGAAAVLKPGGEFRTFGYHFGLTMRGAWHFRREIRRLFKTVEIGRVVWGNLPPAFVYRCVKWRRRTGAEMNVAARAAFFGNLTLVRGLLLDKADNSDKIVLRRSGKRRPS